MSDDRFCTAIGEFRALYAELVVGLTGSRNARLRSAFASIPREDFVGAGPWHIHVGNTRYVETPSADVRFLYQDVVVALDHERGINNGQPSLHARCLSACDPQAGESVVHVGAGTGYYTALLALLVGPSGSVTAIEIDSDLAHRARAALDFSNVFVSHSSGAETPIPKADVIYVCASATHPLRSWLDALRIGGRLVFPFTPTNGLGCMLLVTRTQENEYTARSLCNAAFVPCVGAQNASTSSAIDAVFDSRPHSEIRSLRRNDQPDDSLWCVGDGWWLSTQPIANDVH